MPCDVKSPCVANKNTSSAFPVPVEYYDSCFPTVRKADTKRATSVSSKVNSKRELYIHVLRGLLKRAANYLMDYEAQVKAFRTVRLDGCGDCHQRADFTCSLNLHV